jgi:hypothetical protein
VSICARRPLNSVPTWLSAMRQKDIWDHEAAQRYDTPVLARSPRRCPGHRPVLRADSAVAAFGPGRGVAGLIGPAAPLIHAFWGTGGALRCLGSRVKKRQRSIGTAVTPVKPKVTI